MPRDLTNTGTCPFCFRNVKLRKGLIVLHGYKRPGWGEVYGRCAGVGWEPYERSPEGTKKYRTEVERRKKDLVARIEEVSSDDFKGKLVDPYRRKPKVIEHGEKGWEIVRQEVLGRHRSDLYYLDRDLAFLTKKIDEWHPGMKMPDGTTA